MRRVSTLMIVLLICACAGEEVAGTSSTVPAPEPTTSTTSPVTTAGTGSASSTSEAGPASTTTTTLSLDATTLAYQEVADLTFPIQMTSRPGEPLAYVITKSGRVWAFDGEAVGETPVMDISDRVTDDGERGLLSIALHPSDPVRFYLHYSDSNGDTVVSEFALSSPTEADPGTERVLLRVSQPASNHNGGMLQFTPEGELLLGLGDGGGSDDIFQNGQNPDTLLAGLVSMAADGEPNPTKYAMGLRNPWRFWVDGDRIYIADVGQNAWEEISVTDPLQPGLNYGWPRFEASHCYLSRDCDDTGLVMPVHEIEHGDAGTCSITGGVVYRGRALPQLDGLYFFSDYCGGYLRSLSIGEDGTSSIRDWTGQVGVPGRVTGFGVDGAGEVYVATENQLLRLVGG